MVSATPARRAASIARWVPFSGTIRPLHTAVAAAPGGAGVSGRNRHAPRSTPLWITAHDAQAWAQARALAWETETQLMPASSPALCIALSSHGVGGECRVVSI